MTAGPRALQLIRAAYGSALIVLPGPAIQLATGRRRAAGRAWWRGCSAPGTWPRLR